MGRASHVFRLLGIFRWMENPGLHLRVVSEHPARDPPPIITQFVSCIDEHQIHIGKIRELLAAQEATEVLGPAARLFADGAFEQADVAARRGYQRAADPIRSALFALTEIIRLLPMGDGDMIALKDIPCAYSYTRVSLFDHLNSIEAGKFATQLLASLEVEGNLTSKSTWLRIGKNGPNRISDLLQGSRADVTLALDLLERLHSANQHAYDSCYPQLLAAKLIVENEPLSDRIDAAIARIRNLNHRAILPEALTALLSNLKGDEKAITAIELQRTSHDLTDAEVSLLAMAAAHELNCSGQPTMAVSVISAAAKYFGADHRTTAWLAFLLGDKFHAGRAMLAYGRSLEGPDWLRRIDEYRAVELGCRLLFESGHSEALESLKTEAVLYADAGLHGSAAGISQWTLSFGGFEQLNRNLLSNVKPPTEDPDELRISQRSIAEWHFRNWFAVGDPADFTAGVEWFEKSADGNEAPWIRGERNILELLAEHERILEEPAATRTLAVSKAIDRLGESAKLLHHDYPVAVSLLLKGLVAVEEGSSSAIQDLSLASAIVRANTPEMRYLHEAVDEARWSAVERFRGNDTVLPAPQESWSKVVRILPLLCRVAGMEGRLDRFSPYHDIINEKAASLALDSVTLSSSSHQKGLALEAAVVDIIEKSPGLEVVSVRQRNSYEEIDIVVACRSNEPMLTFWGPAFIIECKNWKSKVGVEPVRAFYTKMITKKGAIRLGIIIATSGFTAGVHEVSRVLQDGVVVTLTLEDLRPVAQGATTFTELLREKIPAALFA